MLMDIMIVPNGLKRFYLLKNSNEFKNIKYMNKKEFLDSYFGFFDNEAFYLLMEERKISYEEAKSYLDYAFAFNDKDILKFAKVNPLFKKNISSITVDGYDFEPYIMKELKKYPFSILDEDKKLCKNSVYEFKSQTNEIVYVANDIIGKLKYMDIHKIKIIISADYRDEVKRIFKWFNLNVNLKSSQSIFSTDTCQSFIKNLKKFKDLNKALEGIPKNKIYNQIVNVLNDTYTDVINDISLEIISERLKLTNIQNEIFENAVDEVSLDDIEDTCFYYILGFNQGVIPHIYQDDDFFSDLEKEKMGAFTSLEKNKLEKKRIKDLLLYRDNIFVSYKLKDKYGTFYPSAVLEEAELAVTYNSEAGLNYSNLYNQILFASSIDNYVNYNEVSKNLGVLKNTYPILYDSYDNSFKGIDKINLKNFLNGKLTLAYTSLNNYYLCSFRYYLKHILNLEPYEESFSILIGNLFHFCLSKMYMPDFDLEKCYWEYLKDFDLSSMERFFLSKLYFDLDKVIKVIRSQDSHSLFKEKITEKKFCVSMGNFLDVSFIGFIDKISKYNDLVTITDYKTGSALTDLSNIDYGLNMQLFIYAYLIKKCTNFKVSGLYLQKILSNKADEDFKLNGYTTNNEEIISLIDDTYENSEVIKGLKKTKNGFSHYAKLFDDLDEIIDKVSLNVDKAVYDIENADFSINPKRIDGKLVSCANCNFKDICFMREENIINIKKEGEEDAEVD